MSTQPPDQPDLSEPGLSEVVAQRDAILQSQPPRDLVRVGGPDAATFLQSQVTQDLSTVEPGELVWTLVLNPDGKIAALAGVKRNDDWWELDVDCGFADALAQRLTRFMIRTDVELQIEPTTETVDPDRENDRIALGWPRMGHEIVVGETIPAGTGLVDLTVSFNKGCFPGQELVERMDSRGAQAPHRLCRLPCGPTAQVGDRIVDADGNDVGAMTSVGARHALGWIGRASVDSVDGAEPVHFWGR